MTDSVIAPMRLAASRTTSTRATPTSQPVSAPPPSNRKRRRLSVESVQVLPSPINRRCGTPGATHPSRHGTKATTLPSASEATTRSLATSRATSSTDDHPAPNAPGTSARNEFHVRSMLRAAAIAGSSTSSSWWTMLPLEALIGSSTIPDVGAWIWRVAGSNSTGSGAPSASPARESAASTTALAIVATPPALMVASAATTAE